MSTGGQNLDYTGRFSKISLQKAKELSALDPPFGAAASYQRNKSAYIEKYGSKKTKKEWGKLYYEPGGWESFIKGTWFPISGIVEQNFKLSDLAMWEGNMRKLADYIGSNIGKNKEVAFARNDGWIFVYKHNPSTQSLELVRQVDPKDFKYVQRVEMDEGTGLFVYLTEDLEEYERQYQQDNPINKYGTKETPGQSGDNIPPPAPDQASDFLKEYGIYAAAGLGALLLFIVVLNR